MNIFFRADASVLSGSGHVMRCLTLAKSLRSLGANCEFICREHPGHLIDYILEQGFTTHRLPLGQIQADLQIYTSWIGDTVESDARQTRQLMKTNTVDWLVVDHYGLVQTDKTLLCGSEFALLRPGFLKHRSASLTRRKHLKPITDLIYSIRTPRNLRTRA